jgi:AraC-like ligand binding domain
MGFGRTTPSCSNFVSLAMSSVSSAPLAAKFLINFVRQGLYVIEGHCTFNAGGKTVEAGPGTFVLIPRSVEHSFTVDAPNSRLLNFYTPSGFEMLLMSIATPAAERKAPVPGSVPMPARWMVEECSREFGQIPVLGYHFPTSRPKTTWQPSPAKLTRFSLTESR